MRVLSIIGARPQFIKCAILQKGLLAQGIDACCLHTGQHSDFLMSAVFFEELGMRTPTFTLELESGDSLSQLSQMLFHIDRVLKGESFDWVIVYGDTTSTLAGSLFAKERGFPLVHIEAGLRSRDMRMPEERNRILSDQLSDLLFAPSLGARENLLREGVRGEVLVSGDVMEDAFLHFSSLSHQPKDLDLPPNFILCTLHRQSNVDDSARLAFLLEGLAELSLQIPILLPLHPRTHKRLQEFNLSLPPSILTLPPQPYLQNLWLLQHCLCVLTDSGGLQKEAYFAKKKTLLLREVSEWEELVECGACTLLGERGVKEAFELLDLQDLHCFGKDFYGGGKSVERIVEHLCQKS